MIYRIDDTLAREQAQWFVIGLVLFAATIILLRDYRVLERYRYDDRGGLAAAAPAPARARDRPAGQRRLPRRRHRLGVRSSRPSSPRSGSSSSWRATCATRGSCSSAGAAVARGDDPAAEAPRPAARRVGRGDAAALLHPRPRLVADVLRRLPGDALRGHEPPARSRSSGLALFAFGAWALVPGAPTSSTASTPGCTRSTTALRRARRQLPARAVALRAGRRRAVRPGVRPGACDHRGRRPSAAAAARGADRPHLRGDRQRARARRRGRRALRLPARRRARLQDRDARRATRSPSCSPRG